MAKATNQDDLDLETLSGRIAYVIKSKGPSAIAANTNLSLGQASRLSREIGGTTLESAAEIALATGFELKWIALGKGPMMCDQELWDETSNFSTIEQLDPTQKINISFNPELLEEKGTTEEDCLTWIVKSHANLKDIKTEHTVLISKNKPLDTGTFVIKANNRTLAGDIKINLDGSAKFITDIDNPTTDQELTKEQLENLEIIGQVIWFGA